MDRTCQTCKHMIHFNMVERCNSPQVRACGPAGCPRVVFEVDSLSDYGRTTLATRKCGPQRLNWESMP